MRNAIVAGAMLAAVAASAVAAPAFAQDYRDRDGQTYADDQRYRDPCQDSRSNGAAAGTVVGAVAGGVIGSNVAGRGNRTGGTIVGALAGGLIGNGIGRSAGSSDCSNGYDARYRDDRGAYNYDDRGYDSSGRWSDPSYGAAPDPYATAPAYSGYSNPAYDNGSGGYRYDDRQTGYDSRYGDASDSSSGDDSYSSYDDGR